MVLAAVCFQAACNAVAAPQAGVSSDTNQAPTVAACSSSMMRINGVVFEFAHIPPGEFDMGSDERDNEKPVHRVRIAHEFWLGKTEVTLRQFRLFTDATGYVTDAEKEGWAWVCCFEPKGGANWRQPGFPQAEDEPVVCLSWNDAVAFCRWFAQVTGVECRLPSEAEWEYACRAGSRTPEVGNLDDLAWHLGNSEGRSHPVARKKPNAWGLFDMQGNGWEWCADVGHPNYQGAPADGSIWTTINKPSDAEMRVLRGGAWGLAAPEVRSASRDLYARSARCNNSGFRVLCVKLPDLSAFSISTSIGPVSAAVADVAGGAEALPPVTVAGVAFDFVRVPAGQFEMGSTNGTWCAGWQEKPVHAVRIGRAFDLGKTEVTVGQYRAFVAATGYQTDAERWAWSGKAKGGPSPGATWRKPGFSQDDQHPVVAVSWNDATAFCRWLSETTGADYRLPTEAEWEYAARAGSQANPNTALEQLAWQASNSSRQTHCVAEKQPNAWGFYDMLGNVEEWCGDSWHVNYAGAPADGRAWDDDRSAYHVVRGGSFWSRPEFTTVSFRNYYPPACTLYWHGFRVARSVPEKG
jgi:formylglycine-generating enzyme required for sulfatase activity